MKQHNDILEIDTMEELTTHCLDQSLEGLEELRRDSIDCGNALLMGQPDGFSMFATLCDQLRAFYVFESDVRSFFMLDTETLRDRQGTLKETEDEFESVLMGVIPGMLEVENLNGVAEHLCVTLPGIIDRFQDLLPTLRNYIEDEYIQPEKG